MSVSTADVGRVPTWNMDWGCPACQRYGAIQVQVTGGPRDASGKPQPLTDDETFQRKLHEAHSEATSGLCTRATKYLLVGRIWRWQRTTEGKQMVILDVRGAPPPQSYHWPPWVA